MDSGSTQARIINEIQGELRAISYRRGAQSKLPDETKCTGKQIARSDMVVCTAVISHQCEFSVKLGQGVFCYHPRRLEIAARTVSRPRAQKRPRGL